jgi:60 kDa SS-A/Ro ribonucleoprotein
MTTNFGDVFNNKNRVSPQQPIPGREVDMKLNRAGGYTFKIDTWAQVRRFLILGSAQTYYASEREMTLENAQVLLDAINEDSVALVNILKEVNTKGENGAIPAPKKAPSLFAMALVQQHGDLAGRKALYDLLRYKHVVRTMSDLLQFLLIIQQIHPENKIPMPSGLKKAIHHFVNSWNNRDQVYQFIKYTNRSKKLNGKSISINIADVLRMTHLKPRDEEQNYIFKWVVDGELPINESALEYLRAYEIMRSTDDVKVLLNLIDTWGFTWEMIPNTWFKDEMKVERKKIWSLLLQSSKHRMPLMALVRNLNRIASYGLLNDQNISDLIVERLNDQNDILRSRITPLQMVNAFVAINKYNVDSVLLNAASNAYEYSFGNIGEISGKTAIFLDVSGSMVGQRGVIGAPDLTAAEAGLVFLMPFIGDNATTYSFDTRVRKLSVTKRTSIGETLRIAKGFSGGGTSIPSTLNYLLSEDLEYDNIIILTDNESWHPGYYGSNGHTSQSLQNYMETINKNVKVAFIPITATDSSVRDDKMTNTLECVGLDTSTIHVVTEFFKQHL